MDDAGGTIAVWQCKRQGGVGEVIQAVTRNPGGKFSEALQLSSPGEQPDVAMAPDGEAVVVWRRFEIEHEGDYAVEASYRPAGGDFSAPIEIAVMPPGVFPREIHVAIDDAGDTAVTWAQQESKSVSVVKASLRASGGSFSGPVAISPAASGESSAFEPRVAIDAAGEATAVWVYEEASGTVVQAASGSLAHGFPEEEPIQLSASGEPATNPAIAMSHSGEASAVWSRSNGANYVVEAAVAPSGGVFAAPLELSNPSLSAFQPEVAVAPSGVQTVVWTAGSGAESVVEAAAGSGGSFGAPVALSEAGEIAEDPQLAVDPQGDRTVVWQRSNGRSEIVQASVGSASGFGAPSNLSAPEQDSRFPMVAMDGGGDATAAWRADGSSMIVQVAGYDADMPRLEDISIPTKGIVGAPVSFSASPFDVWPIASTRFSFGDGAAAAGVSVSHTYTAPGTYEVSAEVTDAAATPVAGTRQIRIIPSNEFAIGRLRLNRRRGAGALRITVPGPGRLRLFGSRVKRAGRRLSGPGAVNMPIVARDKALGALESGGRCV